MLKEVADKYVKPSYGQYLYAVYERRVRGSFLTDLDEVESDF